IRVLARMPAMSRLAPFSFTSFSPSSRMRSLVTISRMYSRAKARGRGFGSRGGRVRGEHHQNDDEKQLHLLSPPVTDMAEGPPKTTHASIYKPTPKHCHPLASCAGLGAQ